MRKLFAGKVKSFAKSEKGATMTEYAIVVGLIAIVAITAVTAFQGSLSAAFTNLARPNRFFTTNSVQTALISCSVWLNAG